MQNKLNHKKIYILCFSTFLISSSFALEHSKKEQLGGAVKNNISSLLPIMEKNGQKVFHRKLRHYCHFTGAKFSRTHTKEEWETIFYSGNFKDETQKICPKLTEEYLHKKIKKVAWDYLFAFVKKYSSDSKVRPSC